MSMQDYIKTGIAKFGENISVGRFARFKLGESA
jgi:translation elongation factor EF-Ts